METQKAKNDRADRSARADLRSLFLLRIQADRLADRIAGLRRKGVEYLRTGGHAHLRVRGKLVDARLVLQPEHEVPAHVRGPSATVKFHVWDKE